MGKTLWTNEWFSFMDNDDECFMLARHVDTGESGVFVFPTEHGAALQRRQWSGKRRTGRFSTFQANVRHNGHKTKVSPGHIVLGVAPDVKVKQIEITPGYADYTTQNLAVTDIGPQEWTVDGDIAWIIVDWKGKKGRFIIDAEDIDRVSGYRWRRTTKGYIYAEINGKQVFLQDLIMRPAEGLCADHNEGELWDNRKGSLRIVSQAENQRNRRSLRVSTTGATGVDIKQGRFRAQIQIDGKKRHLGYSSCIHAAVDARRAGHLEISPDAPEPASDPYKMAQAIKKLRLCGCERCSATVRDYGGDI